MGCFSFLCKACGKPINSSSFRGERCILFLLKNGEVIEQMQGEYDSYGRVFDKNGESIHWSMDWRNVCTLMFKKDERNGIAAYHEKCYDYILPSKRSEGDPNQGWGNFKVPKIPFKKDIGI
jgi:hypothetical protein